jgi:hypothetical protein
MKLKRNKKKKKKGKEKSSTATAKIKGKVETLLEKALQLEVLEFRLVGVFL